MTLAATYGLLAWGMILGSIAGFLPLDDKKRQQYLLAGTAIAMFGLAPSFHGAFGAPSLTLLQIALWRQFRPEGSAPLLSPKVATGLLGWAAVFYPTALGFSPVDPYALGYAAWPVALLTLPLAALAWRQGRPAWLVILGIDLLGYAAGLFGNLWDALADPVLVVLALLVAAVHQVRRYKR